MTPVNPYYSSLVANPKTQIFAVFSLGNMAQIFDPVISPTAVYVVYLLGILVVQQYPYNPVK
jgi:hypothetical protein